MMTALGKSQQREIGITEIRLKQNGKGSRQAEKKELSKGII